MDEKIVQQILDELFPSLEALDTQSAALLQFVRDKKLASDEEIASYFERAGNATNVRWRAARARINYLVSTTANASEPTAKPNPEKDASDVHSDEKAVPTAPTSRSTSTEDKGDEGKGAA